MALPRGTTGSLDPTFVPARLVSLTVKPAYALALHSGFPIRLSRSLSAGPSTRDHRITRSNFRSCSTCKSHSQTGLCSCTPQRVSNPLEPIFERLRYSLGGDRPSQTTRLAVSPRPSRAVG